MKNLLKKIYRKIIKNESKTDRFVHNIYHRLVIIKELMHKNVFVPSVPIEHFYSPFPAIADIKSKDFSLLPMEIPGIDLNIREQLELLNEFDSFYEELPFKDEKIGGLRYFFKNGAYCYSDAIFLYCMIRHLKPQKIIEVGSGFSSCVTLDTNELYFNNAINCTFIEPYPALLKSLIKETDSTKIKIFASNLQDIPLELFKELKSGDILFIDSTHVTKFNSDVNYVIHNILPTLSKGVHIHFHDVFYPFEYPKEWLLKGIAWNEQYILRAFLEYNTSFRIVLFNTYLETMHEEKVKERFPLIYKNTGGSIWIKKV